MNRRGDMKSLMTGINNNTSSIDNKILDTTFGEIRVAGRTNLIDNKSVFGITSLRDKITETDGGSVSNTIGTDSEFNLTTTTTTTSKAILETRSRGRYVAGIEAELGIAIRLPTQPTGAGYYLWGYYDDNDGYGFKYDNSGLSVFIRKGGSDTTIASSDFNINDNLNDINNERMVLDYTKGNIFNISITWYGYGNIIFKTNIANKQLPLHTYKPTGTSTNNPNLPIRAEAVTNSGGESLSMFVAGRQFSHLGSYSPNFRLTPIPVFSVSVPTTNAGSTDNYTPILTIRRKSNYTLAPISIDKIEVICNNDVIVSLFADTTLDGNESFGAVPNINASETSIEYDTSASDFTGAGLVLLSTLALGGSGRNDAITSQDIKSLDLSGSENITLGMRALSSTSTINVILTIKEEF